MSLTPIVIGHSSAGVGGGVGIWNCLIRERENTLLNSLLPSHSLLHIIILCTVFYILQTVDYYVPSICLSLRGQKQRRHDKCVLYKYLYISDFTFFIGCGKRVWTELHICERSWAAKYGMCWSWGLYYLWNSCPKCGASKIPDNYTTDTGATEVALFNFSLKLLAVKLFMWKEKRHLCSLNIYLSLNYLAGGAFLTCSRVSKWPATYITAFL